MPDLDLHDLLHEIMGQIGRQKTQSCQLRSDAHFLVHLVTPKASVWLSIGWVATQPYAGPPARTPSSLGSVKGSQTAPTVKVFMGRKFCLVPVLGAPASCKALRPCWLSCLFAVMLGSNSY